MSFRTKINFQDNRQHHLPTRESNDLSGTTVFGVPFSAMTTGPDLTNSGTTGSILNVVSTFSGNTGTTIFTFGHPDMYIAQGVLSAITSTNSATTQNSGNIFVGNTSQIIDGNLSYLDYSGTSFDFEVTAITETSPGIFTGSGISDDVFWLSAGTLDFTGRTIWSDVRGIHRTKNLIISEGAQPNYVWTAINTDGDGNWLSLSGLVSPDTYTTGATFSGNTLILSNTSGSSITAEWTGNTSADCIGDLWVSAIHGCPTLTLDGRIIRGGTSTANGVKALSLGSGTTADGDYSLAIGRISKASGNYSFAGGGHPSIPNFTGGTATGAGSIAFGTNSKAIGAGSAAFGGNSKAIGNFSFAGGASSSSGSASFATGNETLASGAQGFAIGTKTEASGLNSFAGGFALFSGNTHAAGKYSFVFMTTSGATEYGAYAHHSAILGGYEHNVMSGATNSAILGGSQNIVLSSATNSVILGGSGITGTTSDMVYVPDLVIDGLTSTDPLATDADGKIIAGASDRRLKQNINDLNGGLDKIKALRGVSYEWTEESNMGNGVHYGLIAQEVKDVIPDMVRLRSKGDGMFTLNYNEIVPWLIEAIKEMSADEYTNTILKTQTITAEDNNIELNFGGTNATAQGGGISVKNGIKDGADSFIKIDDTGRWIIGPALTTSQLTLPEYTPSSYKDDIGSSGDIVWDDSFLYIKTNYGWRRAKLETF